MLASHLPNWRLPNPDPVPANVNLVHPEHPLITAQDPLGAMPVCLGVGQFQSDGWISFRPVGTVGASSAVAKQMRPSWTEGEAGKPKHTLLRNIDPALRLTAVRSTIA